MSLPESDALVAQLPHRPPFRFVDAVDVMTAAEHIEARWLVTGEEYFLQGHFPGNPIVPGVIQLEALAQAGALTLLGDERYAGKLALFGGVEKVRFRRVVRPGDELLLVVDVERLSARGGWAQAKATVDGDTTCEARMFFAIG
jgi:3-hydroxyacyl-[acyl-carrier-protein] dehydratase